MSSMIGMSVCRQCPQWATVNGGWILVGVGKCTGELLDKRIGGVGGLQVGWYGGHGRGRPGRYRVRSPDPQNLGSDCVRTAKRFVAGELKQIFGPHIESRCDTDHH